jgi:hypothetical protein
LCRECQSFREGQAQWGLAPARVRGRSRGRPRLVIEPQALHQAALYYAGFLSHLRSLLGVDDIEKHLREQKLEDWLPAVQKLRPYLRRKDAAWGEPGIIGPRRWLGDVQYQAVRRLLRERLGLTQDSLSRRFNERAYWGE